MLGHSPSSGFEPFFGRVSSSSSRRLDSLYHDWPDQALGANVWWTPPPAESHLAKILDETRCEVVVALGLFVAKQLGAERPELLQTQDVERDGRMIKVLVFPHPSGRSRFWNDVNNRVRAADLLKETLLS